MRAPRAVQACLLGFACTATLACASRDHAVAPRPPRAIASTVPDLTPGGRFLYGPSYGQPSSLGASLAPRGRQRMRRPVGASVVPAYPWLGAAVAYPCSGSAFPSFAFSRDCFREEPGPVPAQPPAPSPIVVYVAPPAAVPVRQQALEMPRTPDTEPIYYCAQRKAYTNDRNVLQAAACDGGWRRMTR